MQQGINYAKVKDNATPCGVNLTRSHIVYWAARASIMYRMLINQSAAGASETILEEIFFIPWEWENTLSYEAWYCISLLNNTCMLVPRCHCAEQVELLNR